MLVLLAAIGIYRWEGSADRAFHCARLALIHKRQQHGCLFSPDHCQAAISPLAISCCSPRISLAHSSTCRPWSPRGVSSLSPTLLRYPAARFPDTERHLPSASSRSATSRSEMISGWWPCTAGRISVKHGGNALIVAPPGPDACTRATTLLPPAVPQRHCIGPCAASHSAASPGTAPLLLDAVLQGGAFRGAHDQGAQGTPGRLQGFPPAKWSKLEQFSVC